MSLYTTTSVTIGDHVFSSFQSLKIDQRIHDHHQFELLISYDWFNRIGKGLFAAGKEFLGKEAHISITPVLPGTGYDPLVFNGIVTSVHAGKECDGTHGFCIIRGSSPTVLLENDPHICTFESQSLADIVSATVKLAEPFCRNNTISPSDNVQLKYTVQYKETAYDFLRRLARRHGEWFFYDGQQLVFGRYTPRKVVLTHLTDLLDFDLALHVKPNNATLNGFDYRQDAVSGNHTGRPAEGSMNSYSRHAADISRKLYRKPSLYKMDYPFGSNLRQQVDKQSELQYKGRLATMVTLKGTSKHSSLRIGDTVGIREQFLGSADHGEYVITQLTHTCTSSGEYRNTFEGIPADVAMPEVAVDAHPLCEPQSALVVDNNDPRGLGRVKVAFRWQEQGSTPWLRIVAPHGGGNKGFYFVPEIGEEVWVDFEGGNPETPIVIGATYNGNAPANIGDERNNVKAIRTRSGHTLEFNDAGSGTHLIIRDPGGNEIFLDTAGKNITITAPETMTFQARNMNISVAQHMEVNVGRNTMMSSGQQFMVNAGQQLLMNTPFLQQMATSFMHLQSAKTLINSGNEIKIESPKLFAAGASQLMLHSDEKITANSKGTLHLKGQEGNKHSNKAESYETVKPVIDAKCIVSFRPGSSWQGEGYGIDWMRNGDTGKGGDILYETSMGKYYLDAAFTQVNRDINSDTPYQKPDDAMYDRLKSKYHVHSIPWKTKMKNGKEVPEEYFVAWLSLYPKSVKATKAVLSLDVEVKEEPECLKFEDNEHFTITPKEISSKSVGNHKLPDFVTIECIKEFKTDQTIKVLAVTKGPDGKESTAIAGKICVWANDATRRKKKNILLVEVTTSLNGNTVSGSAAGQEDLFRHSLNQAYIDPHVETTTLNLSADAYFNSNYTSGANIVSFDDSKSTKDMSEYLNSVLKKIPGFGTKYDHYFKAFYLGGSGGAMESGQMKLLNGYSLGDKVVLFKSAIASTPAHEFLHSLKLPHTFTNAEADANALFTYKSKRTDNLMDYSHWNNITRYTLWYWQWRIANAHADKV
ncbi:phage baseplate assembly protein V [Chitinophaga vietnamensis]|uniref:phage baseplate assembly protein V n=1 Tax=Chitinophaga vietnamensis TaxID=2593957 RepID=UPI0011777428|nr:phage baseplate assembly protein V [Chitinophaga vietnamensis]